MSPKKKSKIIDIYNGEYIYIWHDDETVFIDIFPNRIILTLPLDVLGDLFSEFAKAQAIYQAEQVINKEEK